MERTVEFGLLRCRCDTSNLQVIEKPHEQMKVLAWYLWLNSITLWHFSMAWTAALACWRPAENLKKQILQQRLAVKHWLLEYMVDLPVGKRWCLFLCPLWTPERKIPHSLVHNVIIEREFPGAECCLPGVSSSSSILPFFDIPYEPPAWSGRESSELMSLFVAKRQLLEEQQSSACWEWVTNGELRQFENTSTSLY